MNGPQTSTDPGGATLADWHHWDLVLGLGTELLPIVCDPAAKKTPGSTIPKFGKVPSEYAPDGCARGITGWQSRAITPADIEQWSADRRYSMGIRCSAVRALDCDITDAALAERIASFIAARVALPSRVRGNAARFLLAFLSTGVLKKRRIRTASGFIELLADGQQFVAAGQHPSGARYEWEGGLPSEIPTISADALESLWADLAAEFGVEPEAPASTEGSAVPAFTTITADRLADLKSALAHPALLEAAGSNDTWSEVGYALLSLGEQGRGLWLDFSAHAANPNPGPQTAEAWWAAHATQPPRSNFLHVFNLASRLGWANPQAGKVAKPEDFPLENPDKDEAPTTDRNPFMPIPAHEFVKGAPPEYLVDGVLPRTGLAVIYGASGSGKTFLAADIACAIARGVTWRDRQVKQGRVVYICAEGVAGFRKRLMAYAQANAVRLEDMPLLSVVSAAPNLLDAKDALALNAAIQATGGADVIVVDTLAATSPGGNENSSEDMGRVLAHCMGLQKATGALVILIHHSGKDETRGARGWSGLRAAADAEIEIVRDGEARCARITKMKDGEENGSFPFRLLSVPLAFGDDPPTSCVVEHTDAAPGIRDNRNAPRGAIEKLAVSVVNDLMPVGSGVGVPVDKVIDVMTVRIAHDPAKRDRRRERITRAIESLVSHGLFECRNNTLFLPCGIDGPPPGFPVEPPTDVPPAVIEPAAVEPEPPKPLRTRKAKPQIPSIADLIGEPPAVEPAAVEPPKPAPPQPFVLVALEPREPQAMRIIEHLHKLGHGSAHRIGERVLIGPCKHERAAAALLERLAADGFPHARITTETLQ